jgi:tetrapyrrole methylase family protein/MazG family protein
MVDFENKPNYNVYDLNRLMNLLRGPGGCPWDSEQTHESIRRNLLEEAYEAAEAIDEGDMDHLLEELGDVLMQVIFHADIADKDGYFNLDTIADATCKKLIRRHPHVFGEVKAKNGSESLVFWEDIKREEKMQDSVSDSMNSVARSLPALWRAEKIQKKAAKAGFDWPEYSGALAALREELSELENAIASKEGVTEELGDLIFSAVNVARFFDIDPEQALGFSCDKFISRFSWLEKEAQLQQRRLEDMTLSEMENLYQQAKLEKLEK